MASKFGQFLNYYTNQIGAADSAAYQREQTRALQRGNNQADMADTISTLINQGIFDAKGNLTPGGLEKLHDANIGEQYVDFMNTSTVANNFRNKFGDVEKGIILGPAQTEEGAFIFNVRKRDGKLAPLTERRSQDPDDKPLQFSKEDLKNFYEAQARNLLQKGGLVGQAIGTTAEQYLTRMLGDTNLAPENSTDGLAEISQILNKNRSPEEKAAIDSEPSGRDVEFGPSVVAQRQKDKESQFFRDDTSADQVDTSGSTSARFLNMIKPGVVYSKKELEEMSKLIPTKVKGVAYNPRERFLREFTSTGPGTLQSTLDQIGVLEALPSRTTKQEERLRTLQKQRDQGITKRQETAINKYANFISMDEEVARKTRSEEQAKINLRLGVIDKQLKNPNISDGRKKELQEERDKLSIQPGTTQEPPSQIETIPALPDNIQDARQWFTDNQSTLEKLPEEDYTKIQNLLKEQNISSANDLGQAVEQGKISQVDGLKAAALIAFAVNGPSGSITDKLNVYNSLTNTFLRGDPQLTPAAASGIQRDIAAIQSSYASLATAAQTEFFDPIRKSADELRSSFTDDNDQYIKKLTPKTKIAMRKFFSDFLTNAPRLALSDQPRAVAEAKQIIGQSLFILGSDSGNLKDWFGDIIARDTVDPAVGLFDNLRVRRNNKGQAVEIVFVNSVNPQEETEYSVFPPELINQFGKMVELLDNQSGALGIPDLNPRAVEKKKG
jgi:hypothetical protein